MELLLADLEKNNSKYLRRDIDGGILSEKYQVDSYKLEQYANVIDNLMLGNYNEFGEYIIQDEIKDELLKCQKVIEDNYENILFVKSKNPVNVFSHLNFAVRVLVNSQTNQNTAILELLEPIYKAKGYIENTQSTVIKKITLPNNDIFRDEVYKAFNIKVDNNGEGQKIELSDDEFKNSIDRKIRLLYIKKQTIEKMNDEYEICYKKNIQELEKTEIGKKVIQETKKEEKIAQKYLNVKENDYKVKNELLYKNIEIFYPNPPKEIILNIYSLHQTITKNVKAKTKTVKKPKTKENIQKSKANSAKKESLSMLEYLPL